MHLIEKDLRIYGNPEKAILAQRFFKTGKGEYGEGDIFLGVTVPQTRSVVKKHVAESSLQDARDILSSPYHEVRLAALLLLVALYNRGSDEERKHIAELYCAHTQYCNNWDLVDTSAPYIVGPYTDMINDTALLDAFARTDDLWKQRIAIIATYYYIRKNQFDHTLRIADILLHHEHDLIHKAVGWMLREVGNRDQEVEERFLRTRYKEMPRTTLRYAIEKFDEPLRQQYLKGII